MLRIMLVDQGPERAEILRATLEQADCEVVAQVSSTIDLSALVEACKPDLIIIDTDSPERDTLENICIVSRDQPRPIVMFTHDEDSETIRAAIRAGVSAYVVGGLKSDRIKPIMDAAIARFEEFQAMRTNLEKAEGQLADRKIIDRAKAALMKQRGWSEDEAYQALRKMAMNRGVKLGEAARQVIAVTELLG
ncbi:MAG: ANTAR domain-containing protein [Betaproteobacteria bacterium]|nr:ANTAR domain-containing protein [Betaproteobacteria bacterium]